MFLAIELHVTHLNIINPFVPNSPFPYSLKISENRNFHIENYRYFRCNRNWYGRGVVFFIENDVSYKLNYFLRGEMESIMFDILILHTKLIIIRISQQFLTSLEKNLPKLNTSYFGVYSLDNFNINIFKNLNSFTVWNN